MPTVLAGTVRHTGGCLQPVLLRGRADYIDGGTGELLHRYTTVHEPGGILPIACKTRRASRCPPCAEVYRADTYQLIRAGLSGGKGVPATVADHPCVFVTLTAPPFGPVHSRREKDGRLLRYRPRRVSRTCPHGIRMSCAEKHAPDDNRLGEPLCPECYDYTGSVLFNAYAPELWRRFTITLRRTLARQAGLTNKALSAQVRVSYAKVAEYQRRGVVHFHAVIRLDGPAGPTTSPPAWATLGLLTAAIDQAVRIVNVATPTAPGVAARTLARGREHDTRPITTTGGAARYQGRRLRSEVRHEGRRMHRHSRPPHHRRRSPRRPARPRPRPPSHRRMPTPGQAPPAQRAATGRLGAHARLPRPLLDQEPRLLHHHGRNTRRSRRLPARSRHRRRTTT